MSRFCQPGRTAPATKAPYRRVMEDEFDVVIEIPRGSRNKYEYDHETARDAARPAAVLGHRLPGRLRLRPRHPGRGRRPARRARAARGPDVPGLLGPGPGHRRVLDGGREGPRRQDHVRARRTTPSTRTSATSPSCGRACSTRSSTSSTCTRCWSRRRTARPAATRAGRPPCERSPTREHGRRRTPTHATDAAAASAPTHPAAQAAVGSTLNADHSSAY